MAASTSLTPEQRQERARNAVGARWSRDPAGVAELVDRLVRRAPVLNDEQRETIRAALAAPACDQGGGEAA